MIRDRLRRKDATPLMATIAVPSTLALVAQTRQRLLEAARPYAPAQGTADAAEAAVVRQAPADLPETARLVARVTHRRTIGAWAEGVPQALGPGPAAPDKARPRCEAAWALAHRVLADRDEPAKGDQGRRGVDPDARRGTHGASVDGSLLAGSLEADSARLTALTVLPGNGDEARETPARWEAAARAQGHAVEAVSIDGLGWNGEVLRALSAPEGRGVEVDVPPPPGPEETSMLGPEACVLEAPQGVLPCPGGHQTAPKTRQAHHTGWQWVCARRQGLEWRLQAQCLTSLSPQTGRRVSKHDDQAEDEAARARATTPGDAAVRQPPPRVERQRADSVRSHDGRRRRYRGPWRVQGPYLLTGRVVQVKRMGKRRRRQGAQPAWQPVSSSVWRGTSVAWAPARRGTGAPGPSGASTRSPA